MVNSWDRALEKRLAAWKAEGLSRRLRIVDGTGLRVSVDGREVISFASNDYLGLSTHPRLVAAARVALANGLGATASRLICGTRPAHTRLERELAIFKRTEAALVFPSGYQTALATLGALTAGRPEATIVLDRLAHACLLDGAKLSEARRRTFKHNDPEDLERVLCAASRASVDGVDKAVDAAGSALKLVVVESLYSMDGDIAPLKEIYRTTQKHEALLLVDEAHATGVLGAYGRGVLADLFSEALPRDILSMGTLSKALGGQGGFLCGPRSVIDTIVHAGRAFLFSTGLTPLAASVASAALAVLAGNEANRIALLAKSEWLRERLRGVGFEVLGGPGPILPIIVGDEARSVEFSEQLLAAGFWAPAVRFPTVKRGQARLRLSVSALHEQAMLEAVFEEIRRLGG